MAECAELCSQHTIRFRSTVVADDFISCASVVLKSQEESSHDIHGDYNRAILNPPYGKMRSDSDHRHVLRSVGIEANNSYAAFAALVVRLLEPGGEVVAITPRSFCSGPHFRRFRELLLGEVRLKRIHVFDARDEAFRTDDVLQENIIFHGVKGTLSGLATVSVSRESDKGSTTVREVNYAQIVRPDDAERFIFIPTSDRDDLTVEHIRAFDCDLADLGIRVSTGRVVDFRAVSCLRALPGEDTVPLIYPFHLRKGFIEWPKLASRKPNALILRSETESLVLPSGYYVLVRRFSTKEERRRVVATVYDPERVKAPYVGFENHLNVFHAANVGISADLAKGLAAYLNSSLVDAYIRLFNGHTQVNAADLRMLKYPDKGTLETLGRQVGSELPPQEAIDEMIDRLVQERAPSERMREGQD